MISRELKAAYFALLGFPMKVSGSLYRRFWAPEEGTVKVQLGPGREHYLEGWINVDANFVTADFDVWADLRNPLPFRDETVDVFYSHHVIEHLPDRLLPFHFRELYRCLKPGGAFRVGGPNGDAAMRKYVEGDSEWFTDFPDERESLGGRLANFVFCHGEHFTILTPSYLRELAGNAGFQDIEMCIPAKETNYPELVEDQVLDSEYESTPEMPHTLIVEGRRPAGCNS